MLAKGDNIVPNYATARSEYLPKRIYGGMHGKNVSSRAQLRERQCWRMCGYTISPKTSETKRSKQVYIEKNTAAADTPYSIQTRGIEIKLSAMWKDVFATKTMKRKMYVRKTPPTPKEGSSKQALEERVNDTNASISYSATGNLCEKYGKCQGRATGLEMKLNKIRRAKSQGQPCSSSAA